MAAERHLIVAALRGNEPIAPALEAWLSKNLADGADLELQEIARPKGGFSAHTLLLTGWLWPFTLCILIGLTTAAIVRIWGILVRRLLPRLHDASGAI